MACIGSALSAKSLGVLKVRGSDNTSEIRCLGSSVGGADNTSHRRQQQWPQRRKQSGTDGTVADDYSWRTSWRLRNTASRIITSARQIRHASLQSMTTTQINSGQLSVLSLQPSRHSSEVNTVKSPIPSLDQQRTLGIQDLAVLEIDSEIIPVHKPLSRVHGAMWVVINIRINPTNSDFSLGEILVPARLKNCELLIGTPPSHEIIAHIGSGQRDSFGTGDGTWSQIVCLCKSTDKKELKDQISSSLRSQPTMSKLIDKFLNALQGETPPSTALRYQFRTTDTRSIYKYFQIPRVIDRQASLHIADLKESIKRAITETDMKDETTAYLLRDLEYCLAAKSHRWNGSTASSVKSLIASLVPSPLFARRTSRTRDNEAVNRI